jgi:hypothetical protein
MLRLVGTYADGVLEIHTKPTLFLSFLLAVWRTKRYSHSWQLRS